ncbi:hypothetical protein CANARDRAFT_174735 [[Candida] arabinofermentans NRRL YB-2248]|uniref:Uncharacterized protein n=1 Tax=[Candida] arabinofermentans NRRL YB-2248 TaxID=983967 RepID=A0A1E4T4H4_9ASCO|nr:hypothetical protein CANARDRAFT_174735 [[Candida] arabinofermentans NRRL YB-2248]
MVNGIWINQYLTLPSYKEKLDDTRFELKELCGRLKSLNDLDYGLEYRDWIIKLNGQIPLEFNDLTYHAVERFTIEEINNKLLNKLSIKLKHLKWDYNHHDINFKHEIEKIVLLEDKLNAQLIGELNLRLANYPIIFIKNPRINYIISQYVQPIMGKILAFILICLSIIILESETFHGLKFSLIKLIIKGMTFKFNEIYLQIFTISFIFLTYMLICAMISLSKVKIFNIYHIESNQSSNPVSTIFFISYACRLTIPLSYNFLMLLDSSFTKNSQFQAFLGNSIELIPIGNFLNDLLPRLLLIPILLTYFNIFGKLRNWLQGIFLFDYIFNELEFEDERDTLETTNDLETGGSSSIDLTGGGSNLSRTSSDSGISLNTTTNSFDTDNRLLRDDDIMLIDEDEDEDERLVL